jgi:hypothetical protein
VGIYQKRKRFPFCTNVPGDPGVIAEGSRITRKRSHYYPSQPAHRGASI